MAEVKNGKTLPDPSAGINHYADTDDPVHKLLSVQSVVVDPTGNRLWILDTGGIGMGPDRVRGPTVLLTGDAGSSGQGIVCGRG